MLNDTQEKILEFFVRQKDYAWYAMHNQYPFSEYLLRKYGPSLNWSFISENRNLVSDISFIKEYENQLNWTVLSVSSDVPWSELFVEQYKDRLEWSLKNISDSEFSEGQSFSSNSHFLWTDETIQKYKKYIDWEDFSKNHGSFWSEELVDKYAHKMNWEEFAPNYTSPYSTEFIEKYLPRYNPPYHAMGILDRPDLIEKYANSIHWWVLSYNYSLPGNKEFFDKWKHYLNLCAVAASSMAIDSFAKFELFFGELDYPQKFGCLSNNSGIDWSEELLRKYAAEWDWRSLSYNPGLPWSEDMMERFDNYLVFGEIIYDAEDDDYHLERGIELNSSLPWSVDLIKKYEKKWLYSDFIYNYHIWPKAFKPHVNDELVELFLRIVL